MSWQKLGDKINSNTVNDYFGTSTSLSSDGKILAIGAPNDDTNTNTSKKGSVSVFELNNTTNSWVQKGSIIEGQVINDMFGFSVSLNSTGTTLAVGAPFHDDTINNKANAGSVTIYEWNNTDWVQKGNARVGASASDNFGWCVSMNSDGKEFAVGVPNNDVSQTSNVGTVNIYKWSSVSNDWLQKGSKIDGTIQNGLFGRHVSLNSTGNYISIGEPGSNPDPNNNNAAREPGRVKVYEFVGGTTNDWILRGNAIDGVTNGDNFGKSVSLNADGTILAIGAPNRDGNKGCVRIYKFSNNVWNLQSTLDGLAANDNFGHSVSLTSDGTMLAVGSTGTSTNTGTVYIYKWNTSTSTWGQQDKLNGATQGDNFGWSVSLSSNGDILSISSPVNNNSNIRTFSPGSISVYNFTPNTIISNICFPAGTPINTDQGVISIEKINPNFHTIKNKQIKAITKTTTQEKHLVCIEENALGKNIPSKNTIISNNHKIFYKGKWFKAKSLIGIFENIYKIKYNGDKLYNVLMETHSVMIVNNLICETLDPTCDVAKLELLLENLQKCERNLLIEKINNFVIKPNANANLIPLDTVIHNCKNIKNNCKTQKFKR